MRSRAVQRCSLLLALAAVMACEDEGPAAPPADEVAETVHPWTDPYTPCYPSDVLTTRTIDPVSGDTTDTVYTGFEGCGPPTSGIFDMWLWGIELRDPTGEPPQGTSSLDLRSHPSEVLNAPSGSVVAIQRNRTPPIGFIEFEPAVRRVSFAYSVRWPVSTYWNGQLVDGADSMDVRATDGSFILDRVTLHVNSPDYPEPYQAWDTVTLEAATNSIRYIEILGQVAIDDLQIVSGPRPQVKCVRVVRGSLTRCQVEPQGKTVVDWRYRPVQTPLQSLPDVVWESSSTEWAGTVAMGGTVTVRLDDGSGNIESLITSLQVDARQSQWTSMWDYNSDSLETVPEYPITQDSALFGQNCDREFLCTEGLFRVAPYEHVEPFGGASPREIVGGPNDGYWFLENIRYNMFREGNINPAIEPNSDVRHFVPNPSHKCWSDLGFTASESVYANFYEYNRFCVKGKSTIDAMLTGIWGHEGFGVNGGTGHETWAQAGASQPGNDPWLEVDSLVRQDTLLLRSVLAVTIAAVSERIRDYSADPNPSGNWSGTYWYIDTSIGSWREEDPWSF